MAKLVVVERQLVEKTLAEHDGEWRLVAVVARDDQSLGYAEQNRQSLRELYFESIYIKPRLPTRMVHPLDEKARADYERR